MWEISNNTQLYSFFISCIFGAGYCAFYDVFRVVRKIITHTTVIIFFQDILYFTVIGIVTFLLQLAFSAGEIRAYLLLGILLGFVIYNFTLSLSVRKISVFLLNRLIKVIGVILRHVWNIAAKIWAFSVKTALKIKKTLKKSPKKQNNP